MDSLLRGKSTLCLVAKKGNVGVILPERNALEVSCRKRNNEGVVRGWVNDGVVSVQCGKKIIQGRVRAWVMASKTRYLGGV